jgi:hypothetical protein
VECIVNTELEMLSEYSHGWDVMMLALVSAALRSVQIIGCSL